MCCLTPPLFSTIDTWRSDAFRSQANNFHYKFAIPSLVAVFQGLLKSQPAQFVEPLKMVRLWLHESERVYKDGLVSVTDFDKYKQLALEQATEHFPEVSPTALAAEPLIFCHGDGKIYDEICTFGDLSTLWKDHLERYNKANACMNLVLFECRRWRLNSSPRGHGSRCSHH